MGSGGFVIVKVKVLRIVEIGAIDTSLRPALGHGAEAEGEDDEIEG